MDPDTSHRIEREAAFLSGMAAFVRRDFATIGLTLREDVVLELPGSSRLAGRYDGVDEVDRCLLGLRQVLDSSEERMSFQHERDEMIVRHDIVVHGPKHQAEMTVRVRIRFDEEDRIAAASVEPDDQGLFDHVVDSVTQGSAAR